MIPAVYFVSKISPSGRGGLYGPKMGSHAQISICKTYMACFDLNIHNIKK